MPINLGSLSFDDSKVLKQLRSDMKDDWFADPLSYGDMTNGPLLNELIHQNFTANNGQYLSSERHILNLPKPNFTLRYGMETSLTDRFLFHALTSELVPVFDRLLGPSVYSHRYNYDKPNPRYLYRRGIPAWNDFIGSVGSAVSGAKYLLSTDLSNYYEGVELLALKQQLISLLSEIQEAPAEKNRIRLIIEELFRCLENWSFKRDRGLPQNRDASSFLANMYMLPVDKKMRELGYGDAYFRYMDDIKIVSDNEYLARKALKDLILALRAHGLSVNAKKTKIVSGSNKAELAECLEEVSPSIAYLDSIWSTNKPKLILSKIDELMEATRRVLKAGDFSSKEFRFCINRLCTLRMCTAFSVPEKLFHELTPAIIDGLVKMPAATDGIAKYLRAAPLSNRDLDNISNFLLDSQKAIYNWQNYHLWIILTDKRHLSTALLQHAAVAIKSAEDTPNRAGASLYCGAVGTIADRGLIAENFHTLHSFFGQRMALIGVHELPFAPLIRDHVKPTVREDLKGVYTHLQAKKGHYCDPLEPIVLSEERYEEPES